MGLKNAKWPFPNKSAFSGRKSAIKLLCARTVSGKVVTCKEFTGLSNRARWLVGDVPLNVNFVRKVNHLLDRQRHHRSGNPTHVLFISQL